MSLAARYDDDETTTKALVPSDLHCTSQPPGDSSPSFLTTRPGRTGVLDPLTELPKVLTGDRAPDLILCPGDLADKADPDALSDVWRRLNDLSKQLDASLVATVGNHDMDSRGAFDVDPKAQLVSLEPPFPTGESKGRSNYWTYDLATVVSDRWRIVTLNSCACTATGRRTHRPSIFTERCASRQHTTFETP